MATRVAFIGFRHAHILELYDAARQRDDVEVVAACEAHEPTRRQLADADRVRFTHNEADAVLDDVACDAVAIGDYYARRGALAIAALERGRHVILDKPVCTSLDELERMAQLAGDGRLAVGCQLGLHDAGAARTARALIEAGEIGDVQTVSFLGQHPLLYGTRPPWYFEPGKHGGTINDIAIHAMHAIPWITGQPIARVTAARVWNRTLPDAPHFQIGAQLMLELERGGGVLGDVSYLAPDRAGYSLPQYWRFTIHGSGGLIELNPVRGELTIAAHDDAEPRPLDPGEGRKLGYLNDFLTQVAGGTPGDGDLTTADVLAASRWALTTQRAADVPA
ncbi:MAG: Gfo/Idh/MocA family oxidoreductase [Phycisphaeraceae bacterium]